jgi:pimeloyl-ACP methyl ester carboxylesterase
MATFVLVHGAWHGGWCWRKVAPLLRAGGHVVFTPTLTGLGERSHLLTPEVGLATHVQDVVATLEYEDLHEVVLVGHSYGGMVIAGVADRATDRIAHLVYLDAYVPQASQTPAEVLGPEQRGALQALADATGKGWLLPPPPPEALGITDDADCRWMHSRLTAHPLRQSLAHPIRLMTTPAAGRLPCTYIFCSSPAGGISSDFARFAAPARTRTGWCYRELAGGHDAMVTMPDALAALLLELV